MKLTLGSLTVLSAAALVSAFAEPGDQLKVLQSLPPEAQSLIEDAADEVRAIPYSQKVTRDFGTTFLMELKFEKILNQYLTLFEQSSVCTYCGGDRGCVRRCTKALTKLLTLSIWQDYDVTGLHCRIIRISNVSVPFFYWRRCLKKRAGAIDFHHTNLFFPLLGMFQGDNQPSDADTEPCQYMNGVNPECVLPTLDEDDMKALGIAPIALEHPSSASRMSSSAEPRGERSLTMGEELDRLLVKELPVNMTALRELLESAPAEIVPALLTKVASMAQDLKTTDRTRVAILIGQTGGADLGRILLKDNTECDSLVQQMYDHIVMPPENGSPAQGRPFSDARKCKEILQKDQQPAPSGKLLRQIEVLFVASGCYDSTTDPKFCRPIVTLIVSLLQSSDLQEVPMGRVPNITLLYFRLGRGATLEDKQAFFIANALNPQVIVDATSVTLRGEASHALRTHCRPGELCDAAFKLVDQPPVAPGNFCVSPGTAALSFADPQLEKTYRAMKKRTKQEKLVRAIIARLALCHSEAVDDLARPPPTLPDHFNQAAEAFCAARNGQVPRYEMVHAA